VLPTGPALYNVNVWFCKDMRTIRQRYMDDIFYPKSYSGLQSFYNKGWDNARECFDRILATFEDGPSRHV
jgi:hypothetical protein